MGLTSMMRMSVSRLEKLLLRLVKIYKLVRRRVPRKKLRKLKRIVVALLIQRHRIVAPPVNLESPLLKIRKRRRTIDSFEDEEIPVYFQFRTKAQLHQLITGFQIPDVIRIPVCGNIW